MNDYGVLYLFIYQYINVSNNFMSGFISMSFPQIRFILRHKRHKSMSFSFLKPLSFSTYYAQSYGLVIITKALPQIIFVKKEHQNYFMSVTVLVVNIILKQATMSKLDTSTL